MFESIIDNIIIKKLNYYYKKIKIHLELKRLKSEISKETINLYGDLTYYNKLDAFLSKTNFIQESIDNLSINEYKRKLSKEEFLRKYINLFEKENSELKTSINEIQNILDYLQDIALEKLNKIKYFDDISKINNFTQEAAHDINKHGEKNTEKIINEIQKSNKSKDEVEFKFYDKKYRDSLLRLLRIKMKNIYFVRNNDLKEDKCCYELLFEKNKVLLLGEAGHGKTYECLEVLRRVVEEKQDILIIYLPLSEFGILYNSLSEAIISKLNSFYNGNVNDLKKFINTKKRIGEFIIVFDGLDDIQFSENRTKCIHEINNYIFTEEKPNCFITCRTNRYNNEIFDAEKVYLQGFTREKISLSLRNENLSITIPDRYYELFSNPMLLNIGVKILKGNGRHYLRNRSDLFKRFLEELSINWDRSKNIHKEQTLSYSEIVDIFEEYSFITLDKPFVSSQVKCTKIRQKVYQ